VDPGVVVEVASSEAEEVVAVEVESTEGEEEASFEDAVAAAETEEVSVVDVVEEWECRGILRTD